MNQDTKKYLLKRIEQFMEATTASIKGEFQEFLKSRYGTTYGEPSENTMVVIRIKDDRNPYLYIKSQAELAKVLKAYYLNLIKWEGDEYQAERHSSLNIETILKDGAYRKLLEEERNRFQKAEGLKEQRLQNMEDACSKTADGIILGSEAEALKALNKLLTTRF